MTFVKQELSCTQRAWYLRPTWLILFAWLYGISQTLPVFHSADVIPIDHKNSTIYYCTTTQGHSLSGRIYLLASVLLGFAIPLAVLTISYYRVIRVAWTRDRRLSCSVDTESNTTITNAKALATFKEKSSSRFSDCCHLLCGLLATVCCLPWNLRAISQEIPKPHGCDAPHNLWPWYSELNLQPLYLLLQCCWKIMELYEK